MERSTIGLMNVQRMNDVPREWVRQITAIYMTADALPAN